MKEIVLQEKLNSIRNEMSHLWGAMFIVGGGSLAMLLNGSSVIYYILSFLGIIITLVFFNNYFSRRNELFQMFKELRVKNEYKIIKQYYGCNFCCICTDLLYI